MNQNEAQRIAAAINILRPEWSTKLLMMVLGDERMIRRPYADALLALTVCALDPNTIKPGRVHELGPWWSVASAASRTSTAPVYREVLPTDCGICSRPFEHHSALSKLDDHGYEPMSARGQGVGPTPEQKAAIEKARVEALAARPEPEPKREPRPVAEVLAAHTSTTNTTEDVA